MKSILIYESNKNNNNINSNNNDNNNNNNIQGHFESWENRNNINFSQPNTNIASFTMASFNSPDNNSIFDDSTPLPAILSHDTPVRLNVPIEHDYARVDGVFIDTIALHVTICGKSHESKNNFQIYHITNVRMHNKEVKYHTINLFGWNTKYPHMLHHDIHDGTSELMLQIYKFNHVAFRANVLYPYQRRNLNTGIFEYISNSFMRFIPTDNNMNDILYGENGYYCSTMTQAGEYIQLFIQSIEVFQNTPTFRPFYILCLYYDFMSYDQGFIEISLARATLYQAREMACILIREKYKYYKCSDLAFLQALISITPQINPKVEFQANKDSLLIVPQPISIQQYLNESPEADIKNIIIVLNKIGQTGLLTATTPILNLKRGRNQTQLDDSIVQRKISQNPQTLNVKQSLKVLRRINRLKASAMKKKQQLSTQNLVDHVNREAEIFDAIDNSNDEPINVFTIKEQRHSNDNESDNESDHGSIHEDEIENILSPPFLPYLHI